MKKFAFVSSLLLLCTAVAFAAGVLDGGWTGQIGTGDASQTIQMSLQVDGTALSGSIIGAGQEMSIQNGTFDGTNLQFKAINGGTGDNSVAINCNGTYASDAISFVCTNSAQASTQIFTVARNKQ